MLTISNKNVVHSSFYITYAFLMTTATITFIESIRTKNEKVRHILNLETCISVVATFFYGKFVSMLEHDSQVDYKKINNTRYLDWAITTPIMLLVLVLALLYNSNSGSLNFFSFLFILLLNYGMLGFGYLGETNILDKNTSNGIGFLFFAGMYYFIYSKYLKGKSNFSNNVLFYSFLFLWALYGVVYFMNDLEKNVWFNILDLFSKCFVGIFFWAYFTKIFCI